jgi:2-desacetyl-2-hydroxyethyl bacteriochlorophyllide A dehydrogenase
MKALRFDGELKFTRDAPVPRIAGEALVKVITAGICNTDLEIVKGYANFHGTLGHEFVGTVVESLEPHLVGRRVVGEINAGCGSCPRCVAGDSRHCPSRTVLGIKNRDGAFAEFLSLPVRNLIRVPDQLTDESAVFVEPLAAALQILTQADISSDTDVAVVGDGKLSQLIVRAIAHTGCRTVVFGKHRAKLDLAARAGANAVLIGEQSEAGELAGDPAMSERTAEFDVVIEASGSRTGLATALSLVRPQGTVVLKSTYHEPAELMTSAAVVNEITIVGSRCGRLQPALDLLVSGRIDLSDLVSLRAPLDEGLEAFGEAARPQSMKVILNVS